MIKNLQNENLNDVLIILNQDSLRGYNGLFAESEKDWIEHFINDNNCFALGYFENEVLISVLISERLSFNGCKQMGFGSKLLEYFEIHVKQMKID